MGLFSRRGTRETEVASAPTQNGAPQHVVALLRRRWDYLNEMRQYAVPNMIGMPFGQPQHVDEANRVAFAKLSGMADVRDAAEAFAFALLEGTAQGRISPDDIRFVIGADDQAAVRVDFLNEQAHVDVRRLTGGAMGYLDAVGQQSGEMLELARQRDDVACEMLAWTTVTMLRLEERGLLPRTPHEAPV